MRHRALIVVVILSFLSACKGGGAQDPAAEAPPTVEGSRTPRGPRGDPLG